MPYSLFGVVAARAPLVELQTAVLHPAEELNHGFAVRSLRLDAAADGRLVERFWYLTTEVEEMLREFSRTTRCIYVESEFFGGIGDQRACGWEDGRRALAMRCSEHGVRQTLFGWRPLKVDGAVSAALEWLGVPVPEGADASEVVGLSRRRDWAPEHAYR